MRTLITTIISVLALLLVACAGTSNLRTEHYPNRGSLQGNYDLILYRALEGEDEIKVAILDLNGDSYSVVPYAAEFNYKTTKALKADKALELAEEFLSTVDFYDKMVLRKVFGPDGELVAIEGRPLHEPFMDTPVDITFTNYYIQGPGIIKVTIRSLFDNRKVRFID